jgi:hypothetical protein
VLRFLGLVDPFPPFLHFLDFGQGGWFFCSQVLVCLELISRLDNYTVHVSQVALEFEIITLRYLQDFGFNSSSPFTESEFLKNISQPA